MPAAPHGSATRGAPQYRLRRVVTLPALSRFRRRAVTSALPRTEQGVDGQSPLRHRAIRAIPGARRLTQPFGMRFLARRAPPERGAEDRTHATGCG